MHDPPLAACDPTSPHAIPPRCMQYPLTARDPPAIGSSPRSTRRRTRRRNPPLAACRCSRYHDLPLASCDPLLAACNPPAIHLWLHTARNRALPPHDSSLAARCAHSSIASPQSAPRRTVASSTSQQPTLVAANTVAARRRFPHIKYRTAVGASMPSSPALEWSVVSFYTLNFIYTRF